MPQYQFSPSDVLHGDFETFSYCELKKTGGYRYAQHATTEILCFAWAINEGEVYIWVPCITEEQARHHGLPRNQFWRYGKRIPDDLAAAIQAGVTFCAHNVSFERAIWELIVVRKHGGPRTKRHQFNCTSIRAAAAHLPRSLEGAAMALDAKNQKDAEGKRLLKKFAMPRKPTKNDDRTRVMPLDEPDEFKLLCNYCVADVRAERDIDKQLPQLHPLEQKLLAFDMEVNERGLLIDIAAVRQASTVLQSLEANIVAEVQRRTVCEQYPEGLRPTQGVKMLKFFQDMGVALENLQADHVRKYLRDNISTLPELARELLLLRIEAGRSSTKKFISMEHYAGTGDNRARGTILMYGAHTGRFCLAMGSLVITKRGNVPIEDVTRNDLVWDGISWVQCEGSVYSGYKSVISRCGIVATPDHMVWLSSRIGTRRLADAPRIWVCMPDERDRVAPNPGYDPTDERAHTFDIVNAGPRNRFALSNGCIVSNSGRGIQPHNFSRGILKYDEVLRVFGLLALADHEVFSMLYEWPISIIGSTMRGYIIPTPGKVFRVADYASIEARVLAWLAREMWVLEVYASGQNLYKRMAAAVFNIPGDPELIDKNCNEYKIGKNLVLGCGYGLGGAKFVAYSEKAGVEISEAFAKQAVGSYRNKHPKIVKFWGDVERCAIAAVQRKHSIENPVRLRNLDFYMEGPWLCIRLPSGRPLRYYRPRVVPVEKWGNPSLQLQYKTEFRGRLVTESTYGGKLVENITQAIARDLLVNGMFKAEEHGYRVHGTVHDEIITEQYPHEGSVKELERVICILPEWAKGLPLTAEGFESTRYRK